MNENTDKYEHEKLLNIAVILLDKNYQVLRKIMETYQKTICNKKTTRKLDIN